MQKYFQGNKKYYSIAFLSVIAIVCLGIVSPLIIDNTTSNWDTKLEKEIASIEKEIQLKVSNEEIKIQKTIDNVYNSFPNNFKSENELEKFVFDKFISIGNSLFIGLYDEYNNPVGWSKNTYNFPLNNEFSNKYNDEVYFIESELFTFMVVAKQIRINKLDYKLLLAHPIKKKYQFQAKHYKNIDFFEPISNARNIEINFSLDTFDGQIKDGRFHFFKLKNKNEKEIGVIKFQKPLLDSELNKINNTISALQTILVFLGIIFLLFDFSYRIRKIKYNTIKFLIYSLVFLGLRILLFNVDISFNFIPNELSMPAYFSSTFGYGIVKSPLELFLSALCLGAIVLLAFYYQRDYLKNSQKLTNPSKTLYVLVLFSIPTIILLLRALGAIIRSVVFDSTLLYFAEFSLIPDSPIVMMNLNILFLGFSIVLLSMIFINYLYLSIKQFVANQMMQFLIVTAILILTALLFHIYQATPQVPIITKILYIIVCSAISNVLLQKKSSIPITLFLCALTSSIATVLLMNNYNSELERESLKEYAVDISRQKENWYEYIVFNNLSDNENQKVIKESLENKESNFDAVAFKIWAKSAMQKNALDSKVSILDTNFNVLGKFSLNYNINNNLTSIKSKLDDSPLVEKNTNIFNNDKTIIGLVKIYTNDQLRAYLNIEIHYDIDEINLIRSPKFIVANNQFANLAIDFNTLRIFDFYNGELKKSFGDLTLSSQNRKSIKESKFNKYNECWLHLKIDYKTHLVYLHKTKFDSGERIVAVALEEKDFSLSLFHFFKVFFIHILFIISFLIVYIIYMLIRYRKLETGFRTKLLTAFLVISIIPLVLMAIYFQNLTLEKNISAIDYKLKKRAISIEEYLQTKQKEGLEISNQLMELAENDLNIKYTVFVSDSILFSSEKKYYSIGLLPKLPDASAYKKIIISGESKFLATEFVEDYQINSIYYSANIFGKSMIIKVSDAFNAILLPMSSTEISIFLFGSYSLAAILIIIVSTFLANQISSPIRKLTHATKSVASGDYGFELIEDTKGELQTLVDGFNTMVKQLKKSQTDLAEIERESAWKEMAKQVAHEIKNPLTPMKLSIQQLVIAYKDQHPKFDEIFKKVTDTQIAQIETLVKIATEFSNFARMPKLKLEEVDLVKVSEEVIDLFSDEKANVRFSSDNELAIVTADGDQLKRLFINLIRNSIQASSTKVNLIVETKLEEFFIRVKDDGSGIPKEILEKIFEEEFTTKLHGMGIGLSMAKRFVEIIGGEIFVEHSSSSGTTILIKLIKKTDD